jgi:dimethyladenosine transferase
MKDIAKQSNTLYLLEKYKLKATKKFGQNFLIDFNTVQKIAFSTNIDKETCVIEIGPGLGALSEQLSYQAGYVICYEIDTRLKNVLEETLGEFDNIKVIFQDFLSVSLKEVVDQMKKKYKKVCIVSNLPYYITTDILEFVLSSGAKIDSIHTMVQKEVALKLVDSHYVSPLTLLIQSLGTISLDMMISRHVFHPSPRVDSAIISIHIERDYCNHLDKLLKKAFTQKRKTIYNNLKELFLEDTESILEKCGIQKQKRPEEIKIEEYIALTKYL